MKHFPTSRPIVPISFLRNLDRMTTADAMDDIVLKPHEHVVASGTGAVLTSVFVTPMDVIKIRLQKQIKSSSPFPPVHRPHKSHCLTPLDVVKVRLQSQQRPMTTGRCFVYCNGLMDHLCTCIDTPSSSRPQWYCRPPKPSAFTGTWDAMVKITRYEGMGSLWSGLSPTLVMAVPATMGYFGMNDFLNARLRKKYGSNQFWTPMVAGCASRSTIVVAISPLEMIRTKLQSEQLSYKEILKAVQESKAVEGYRVFWKGLSATLLRDVPFSAIYWGMLDYIRSSLAGKTVDKRTTFPISFISGAVAGSLTSSGGQEIESGLDGRSDLVEPETNDQAKPNREPFGGFVGVSDLVMPAQNFCVNDLTQTMEKRSKQVASIVTLPFDVIKTHKQIQLGEHASKSSYRDICLSIFRKQGYSGFFTGSVPRVIKVAPACAIMIGTYDYAKLFFIARR